MAVVRIEAITQLAKAIGLVLPELAGRICLGQADPRKPLAFPSLAIDPVRWVYHPDQALEVFESTHAVVINVGRHQGDVQLIVGAATLAERWTMEQTLIDLFLSTPLHPGILITPVTACEHLGPFKAVWELESDEWRDERAFSQAFYSQLMLTATLPALVTRHETYTIDQLQLGLHVTPTPNDGDPPAITDTTVELVTVNEDGTITAVA